MAQPSPPSLDDLRAERPIALFCDFDGTLVELAPTPDGIDVPDGLAARLKSLCERLDHRFALVSGRAIDDLEKHLGPVEVCVSGSHGAARRLADGSILGQAPKTLPPQVVTKLRDYAEENGLSYEEKTHGGALHYRKRPDFRDEALAFANDLADENCLSVKTGKFIIELVHPGADKGGAVRAFMAEEPFSDAMPIFIGDDVTDEDGFAACEALGGFGIAVGERKSESARYHLDTVERTHKWLGI